MRAILILTLATFMAGCSAREADSSVHPTATPTPEPNLGPEGGGQEPVVPAFDAPAEILNETYTYQPATTIPPFDLTLHQNWQHLNWTATLRSTALCYAHGPEMAPDLTYYPEGVYVTHPSGNETFIELAPAALCDGILPPGFREPVHVATPYEPGTWTVTIRGTGANMELDLTAIGA